MCADLSLDGICQNVHLPYSRILYQVAMQSWGKSIKQFSPKQVQIFCLDPQFICLWDKDIPSRQITFKPIFTYLKSKIKDFILYCNKLKQVKNTLYWERRKMYTNKTQLKNMSFKPDKYAEHSKSLNNWKLSSQKQNT